MPNQFVGDWGSHLERFSPSHSGDRLEGVFHMREIGSDTLIGVTFEDGVEFLASNSDVHPRHITLQREFGADTIIIYDGYMTTPPSAAHTRICGTYSVMRITARRLVETEIESGDWTANRPPPDPGGKRRKSKQ